MEKKNVALLILCQALTMTSMTVLFTVAALIGSDLIMDKSLATLPLALLQLALRGNREQGIPRLKSLVITHISTIIDSCIDCVKEHQRLERQQQWATQQWGQAELGDARRNQRAIQIGAEIAAKL